MEQMEQQVLSAADLTVDLSSQMVKRGGREIFLTAREYALLELLLRHKGQVLSRDQIETALWDADYEGGTNIVAVYINYLREKIDSGSEQKLIQTVRGSGYVLLEEP